MLSDQLTSAELEKVEGFANQNDVIVISPSNTATFLSIAGDNIFRLVPDDTHQGQVIAKQIWKDGIKVVIPIWRQDVYGNRLVGAMRENFQMLGGKVFDGVGYSPPTWHFSISLNRINLLMWDDE